MSEALIFTSTNPQYDNRLFIDLPVQYMKTASSEHGENMLCTQIVCFFVFVLTFKTIYVQNMFWTGKSMYNLLSYCGLVDVRIYASDKDLPVWPWPFYHFFRVILVNLLCPCETHFANSRQEIYVKLHSFLYVGAFFCVFCLCWIIKLPKIFTPHPVNVLVK